MAARRSGELNEPLVAASGPGYGAASSCQGQRKMTVSPARLSRSSVASVSRRFTRVDAQLNVMGISLPSNFLRMILVSLFAICSSLATTVLNKQLFNKRPGELSLSPLAMMPFQMIGSVAVSAAFGSLCALVQRNSPPEKRMWPTFSINFRTLVKVLPLATIFLLRIYTSNKGLAETPISTYHVMRQFSIAFSVIFSWIILGLRPTMGVVGASFVIMVSVIMSVPHSHAAKAAAVATVTPAGVAWSLSAAFVAAMYLVIIKWFLPVVNNNPNVLLNYNCLGCFMLSVPVFFYAPYRPQYEAFLPALQWIFSFGAMTYTPAIAFSMKLIANLVLSTLSGFLINISSIMLVKEASPVTFDVVGCLKGVAQTAWGIGIDNDPCGWTNLAGIGMSLLGGLFFGKAKHAEHKAKVAASLSHHRRKTMRPASGDRASRLIGPAKPSS